MREADLAMRRRLCTEDDVLAALANLAITYGRVGRVEHALQIERDVYSGRLNLHGEEQRETLLAANNLASSLVDLQHFEEAKSLLRKMMPVARRVLGDSNDITLKMRWNYADVLYQDPGATGDDVHAM